MTKPAFQRRHYARVAAVIRSTRLLPHDSAEEAWTDLIENLADAFAADNGEFCRTRFKLAAAPLTEEQMDRAWKICERESIQ